MSEGGKGTLAEQRKIVGGGKGPVGAKVVKMEKDMQEPKVLMEKLVAKRVVPTVQPLTVGPPPMQTPKPTSALSRSQVTAAP